MTDNSLLEDFAYEAREHLEELENSLLRLSSDPDNQEMLNTIFRSMHTIKGASEYLGFDRIARLSHRLETLLESFRDGSLHVDKVAVDLLIDARDRISELISQVEASGRETAEIDDILDRVASIVSGLASDDQEADTPTLYDGEADAELFDIFMEQLTGGIGQLMDAAGRLARGEDVVQAAEEMADQVDRLASTANYMGYDALSVVYDDMAAAIGAFTSRSTAAETHDIEAFLKAAVASGVGRIQALFPKAKAFESIDFRISVKVSDDLPPTADGIAPAFDECDPPCGTSDNGIDSLISLDLDDDPMLFPEDNPSEPPATEVTDNSLLEDFADEAREHLEELENSLLRLSSDPDNQEMLNTIFRSMHTIKGASEYLGFDRIARLSHRLETLLESFRDGSLHVDKVAVDLLIDARDRISELISQVEASGRETAEIDDILDRVASIVSGLASDDKEADTPTLYDGEADAELFDIFMEQLTGGIGQLMDAAGRLARGEDVVQAAEEMADQVDRLASTANYMGYDALSVVYDDMAAAIGAFTSRSTAAETHDIEAFLKAAVASGVGRIQALFPNDKRLAVVDTTFLTADPINDTLPELMPEPCRPPAADITQMLTCLPAMNDEERESLFSKSLDENFASMRSHENHAGDKEIADGDVDPISLQFSSEEDGTDGLMPDSQMDLIRDDATFTILDEFGLDANDHSATGIDGSLDPNRLGPSESDGDETELWPEAAKLPLSSPEIPLWDPAPTLPTIDFSATPAPEVDEKIPSEPLSARPAIRKSIRVDADKVDELMNQVGELVVNRSSFTQLFEEMREVTQYLNHQFSMDKAGQRMVSEFTARLNDATTVLGRVTGELQEQVMKVRMLPISRLFNRYPRLVHDLLKKSEKKIQIQFRGEETELDRMVIEQLADPMIHIIRNAVDHGIESCDERKRKGKSDTGVLLLEAYHEGSNVVIDVTDDGNGIDLSRIRKKAVEKKLANRESMERMEQQALVDMIMLPGFSTANQVTHTSGRGVGMDVVKRSIEKINGSLVVETRQDVGTRIRIKIPLTLAIIPALMIRCGSSHFTLPMSAVHETLRIDPGEIFTVDGSEVMHLHEEPMPLVRLADVLNMPASNSTGMDSRLFVVVVNSASGRTGFIVDTLLGRQEVVVKPLEDYLQENSGFSGATILGDGGISLILNVDELVVMARQKGAERKLATAVL